MYIFVELFRRQLVGFLTTLFLAPEASSSAAAVSGTIDGKPIVSTVLTGSTKLAESMFVLKKQREPTSSAADQAEIETLLQVQRCDRLKAEITTAAREKVKQQLGVVVTTQDLEAVHNQTKIPDQAAEASRATTTLNALSAVYDQHQDRDQVYNQMLQKQMAKNVWLMYLHSTSTPEGRAAAEKNLRARANMSAAMMKRAVSSLEPGRWIAERRKLDAAVDDLLASQDSQFWTDLQHVKARASGGVPVAQLPPTPTDPESQYLWQKRSAYWKSQVSRLDVYLSDPSIAKTCNLDAMGVRLANK